MFGNLLKAALSVVVTPIDLVVDVVKLPVTAFEDTDPFENTTKRLKQASTSLNRALD